MNGKEKEIIEVALDDIIPNRFQPRLSFDEQGLNELAESIRQHGIIQPLVLRKIGDKYEIIAGERRYKASYIAGLTKVPAVVINLNDNESAEVAIVENIQRKDLSAIEEAKSYKKLLDRGYLTQDQLASRMGKTQATVSNKLRLLNLDEKVQDALLNNKISERHARSLLKIENPIEQRDILDEIINNRLNVRDTEDLINKRLGKVSDTFVPVSGISNLNVNQNDNEKIMEFPKFIFEKPTNPKTDTDKTDSFKSEPVDINDFFNIPSLNNNENKVEDPILKDYGNISSIKNEEDIEEIETISDFMSPINESPKIDNNNLKTGSIGENILPFNVIENKDINMVIEKINNIVNEINSLGFNVKLEQYDFDKLYQFIIKINKD